MFTSRFKKKPLLNIIKKTTLQENLLSPVVEEVPKNEVKSQSPVTREELRAKLRANLREQHKDWFNSTDGVKRSIEEAMSEEDKEQPNKKPKKTDQKSSKEKKNKSKTSKKKKIPKMVKFIQGKWYSIETTKWYHCVSRQYEIDTDDSSEDDDVGYEPTVVRHDGKLPPDKTKHQWRIREMRDTITNECSPEHQILYSSLLVGPKEEIPNNVYQNEQGRWVTKTDNGIVYTCRSREYPIDTDDSSDDDNYYYQPTVVEYRGVLPEALTRHDWRIEQRQDIEITECSEELQEKYTNIPILYEQKVTAADAERWKSIEEEMKAKEERKMVKNRYGRFLFEANYEESGSEAETDDSEEEGFESEDTETTEDSDGDIDSEDEELNDHSSISNNNRSNRSRSSSKTTLVTGSSEENKKSESKRDTTTTRTLSRNTTTTTTRPSRAVKPFKHTKTDLNKANEISVDENNSDRIAFLLAIEEKKREKERERCRIYNEKNREKRREYYEKNREKKREYHREYNEKNREKKREYDREYNEKNREKINEQNREYYEKNKEKWREYDRKRRENKKKKN